jgi:thiamine biosynthesis lipoprotein
MKRREFVGAIASGVACGALPAIRAVPRSRPREERLVERWSWAMGQPVHLRLFSSSEDEGLEAAALALAELRRVEARLSLFDSASDLVELNRRAGKSAVRVGPDLHRVVTAAEAFRRLTGGAFNAGVEPLMRAWGFRERRKAAPGVRELQEAEAAVAAALVEVEGTRVRLPSSHTQLDFGGIGVGYGLDRMAALLRRRGIGRALIDVSGDCIGIGAPPGQDGWTVDIVDPDRPGRRLASTKLRGEALATSANTVSIVRYGSFTAGHVMDPTDGWPARGLRQATVVAGSAIEADVLSTAMLVSGNAPGARRVYRA